ncbi:hypothetical protein [Pseudomonas sp. LS-2]|uniref:hypothetical protein n=1 Tax=Pseudomonas sp. LS-2 TaxID=2315859 RepID=UPI000E76AC46|nr:hypothetical protein [Pseudomonas sp. LS-2]RJX82290.1 hypothetical protein D3M70_06880 [Pseudomonas sp. LS-2]
MSHIVRARVAVAYTDLELLKQALSGLGNVYQNEKLYRIGFGLTSERYELVLIDARNTENRLGFNLENGVYNMFVEDYGSSGVWTRDVSGKIADRYLAHHYAKQLKAENYNVSIVSQGDGTLEVIAEEVVW